ILYASFQQDFLEAYPRWPYWNAKETFGLSRPVMALIYETFYGLDFLSVELIFRGALVIGMVKIMGKDAILPMVAVYAFLHFGKPLGETISSVFGGYILGVIALYSRSILGGFILHVGVAYMMEIAAYIQHFLMIKNH
ncbi:MAG: CAAX protease family protein, partial [Marinilabiliales bacterium]